MHAARRRGQMTHTTGRRCLVIDNTQTYQIQALRRALTPVNAYKRHTIHECDNSEQKDPYEPSIAYSVHLV